MLALLFIATIVIVALPVLLPVGVFVVLSVAPPVLEWLDTEEVKGAEASRRVRAMLPSEIELPAEDQGARHRRRPHWDTRSNYGLLLLRPEEAAGVLEEVRALNASRAAEAEGHVDPHSYPNPEAYRPEPEPRDYHETAPSWFNRRVAAEGVEGWDFTSLCWVGVNTRTGEVIVYEFHP